jgi:uridylate kinase
MTVEALYRRVVFKVSGESLSFGSQPLYRQRFEEVATAIAEVHGMGVDIIVVIGGGNIWRGPDAVGWNMDSAQADTIGMYGTGLNVAVLTPHLQKLGVPTETLTRGSTAGLGPAYDATKLCAALDRSRVVLLPGGMGVSGISTDVAAVAAAIDADADAVIMSKHGVDGVYDRDPKLDRDAAVLIPELNASDALIRKLAVMDATALTMAIAGKTPIHVIPAAEASGLRYVIEGKKFGSKVLPL